MKSVSIGPLSPLAALDLPDLRWDCVPCQILQESAVSRANVESWVLPFAVAVVAGPTFAVTADVPAGLENASQKANPFGATTLALRSVPMFPAAWRGPPFWRHCVCIVPRHSEVSLGFLDGVGCAVLIAKRGNGP